MKKILLSSAFVLLMTVVLCFSAGAIKAGDVITLGTYKGKSIQWICVGVDNNGPLMLAKDVICTKEYDAPGKSDTYHIDGWGYIREAYGSNCWYDSNIRQWLNSKAKKVNWTHCPPSYSKEAGFLTNFTSDELSCIKSVNRIVNVNGYETKREGYCDGGRGGYVVDGMMSINFSPYAYYYKEIKDSVFLLNAAQYNSIYNMNPGFLKASSQYWTCVVPKTTNCFEWVASVYPDGISVADSTNAYFKLGVRPAFYLNSKYYNALARMPKTIKTTKTSKSVKLEWNKVSGATGYRVFQKTSSGWKTLKNTTDTSYEIKNLKAGTNYTFAVRVYTKINEKVVWAKKYKTVSVTTSGTSELSQVKNLKAKATSNTVSLTWSKVSKATGYEVYLYDAKTKKYTFIGDVNVNSCKVKKLKPSTTYRFAVKAYKKSGGNTVYGKYSSVVKVTTLLAAPTLKVTSTSKGKANLTWTNISGESGYAIYMATSKNGTYKHLYNYRANATKDTKTKLTSGKTYYFKVRAYKTVNGAKTYGDFSAVKSVKVK